MKVHMFSNIKSICSCLFLMLLFPMANAFPQQLIFNQSKLDNIRLDYKESKGKVRKEYERAVKSILKEGDKALANDVYSVIDKELLPPSGDRHDYYSTGKYWWPDPSKPDGLPYIQKDGKVNPDNDKISDSKNMDRFLREMHTLSTAAFISGKKEYSQKAEELLNRWFIDTTTKMNPNLNYAQVKIGYKGLLYSGIIDVNAMYTLVESVIMLKKCNCISEATYKGTSKWLEKYFVWLTTSKSGVKESKSENNHGSWYDVQVVSLSLFLGKNDFAKSVLEKAKESRFSSQIEPDGRQPLELKRTLSMNYSCFSLKAFCLLAKMGEKVGVDLWNYEPSSGRGSLKKAVYFMLPFMNGDKKWETQQIKEFEIDSYIEVFVLAASKYSDKSIAETAFRKQKKDFQGSMKSVLF